MSLLAATILVLALTTLFLGLVLVRAATKRRAWFMAIDPALSEQPFLFWYCVSFTLLPFLGGVLFTAILVIGALK